MDVDPLSQPVRGVTLFYMHWCPLLAVQGDNLEMRQDMKDFMRDSAYIQCAPHILEDGVTCCLQPRVHGKLYSQSSMHNCRAVMWMALCAHLNPDALQHTPSHAATCCRQYDLPLSEERELAFMRLKKICVAGFLDVRDFGLVIGVVIHALRSLWAMGAAPMSSQAG